MPWSCFGYPADVPPGRRSDNTGPGLPPGLRRMPVYCCFSYPHSCFSYPADVTSGNRGGAQPISPELRRMPNSCFRY